MSYPHTVVAACDTHSALPAILITGGTDPKVLRSMSERDIVVVNKIVDMETFQAYIEDMT